MKIVFGGHTLFLHPSGAVFWPTEKILVVSDLHLEKGSHYGRKGFFLPPYDSRHSLAVLQNVIAETQCSRLVLLGDSFHDEDGYRRLGDDERSVFNGLTALNPVWIKGNHDKDFVPPGFAGAATYTHKGIRFIHEASSEHGYEISGHFHPKVEITPKGRITRPCFIEDGVKMIAPAFGAYTGGLSIRDAAFESVFRQPVNIYALGKDRVYRIDPAAAEQR